MANPNRLKQTLSVVGLGGIDPCDPAAISKKLQEKFKELKQEVTRTINALSAKAFGNFLVTVAFLMAQLAAGAGLAVLEAVVVGGVFGNIIGTVSLLVGLVVASLTGVEIMLKYLAAERYHDVLIERIEMGQALDSELSQMISFFIALENTLEEASELDTESIRAALPYVRQASVNVGSEATRIQQGNQNIDSRRIEQAQDNIDNAIDELTFGSFEGVGRQLQELQDEFNIDVDLGFVTAGVPNPVGFVNYINELSDEINDTYFSEDLTPEQRQRNARRAKQFFLELIPILPKALQRAAYVKIFEARSDRIFDMIPVEARALQPITDDITGDMFEIPDELLEFFETRNPRDIEPVNIDNSYNELTLEASLAEIAIENLPSWMDEVQFEAGVFKNMLMPASKKLTKIRNEMNSYLVRDIDSVAEQIELSSKKINWSVELASTKGLLRAAIGPSITFDGLETNPREDQNIFEEANKLYEKLRVLIEEQQENDHAGDVYSLAQQYLSKLVASPAILLIPGAAKNTLAGLQAIRFSVREQIKKDQQAKALSQRFLHKVEQSVYFNEVIRPSFNEMMSTLQSSQLARGIVGQLMKGDLSSLVNALKGVQAADVVGDVLNCYGVDVPDINVKDPWDAFAKTVGSQFESDGDQSFEEWYEQFQEEAKQSLNTLKDKKAQLNVLNQQVNA